VRKHGPNLTITNQHTVYAYPTPQYISTYVYTYSTLQNIENPIEANASDY